MTAEDYAAIEDVRERIAARRHRKVTLLVLSIAFFLIGISCIGLVSSCGTPAPPSSDAAMRLLAGD